MKRILKMYWPILCALVVVLAAGIIGVYALLTPSRSPISVAEGYLRATKQYNANDLVSYASDYQIVALSGNHEIDRDRLRDMLRKAYATANQYADTRQITFSSREISRPESDSEQYRAYLEEYGRKADTSCVDAFALVEVELYLDGALERTYPVVTVQCDGRWYYGFNDFG